MPTYEYHCLDCKHTFNTYQKITESPLTCCPVCLQETLRRGIGGGHIAFRFQGAGFYETDYNKRCECSKKDGESCSQE